MKSMILMMLRAKISIALCLVVLTGCNFFGSGTGYDDVRPMARLTLEVQIGADGRLYKPVAAPQTPVSLEMMVVTLTSGSRVLRDTIRPTGSVLSLEPAYLSPYPEYSQSLHLRYELEPNRQWHAAVQVIDGLDSVRYAGELLVDDMDAYEYLDGCLPVEPRYAVFEARFRLPGQVEADGVPGSARALRDLYFTRLTLLVEDGILIERSPHWGPATLGDTRFRFADPDKLHGAGDTRFFVSGVRSYDPPISVSYDYASLNHSDYRVAAYGYVEGDTVGVTPERLLYEGEKTVSLPSAKVTVQEAVAMEWKAVDEVPSGNTATGFSVSLGRAGKVVINAIIPAGIDI